jgi:hypothetical protein
MEKKLTTICFRTSAELRRDLEKLARDDRRSLSQKIEMILEEAVKEKGPPG